MEGFLIGDILPWLTNNALTITPKGGSPNEMKVLELPWCCWQREWKAHRCNVLERIYYIDTRTYHMPVITRRTSRTCPSLIHKQMCYWRGHSNIEKLHDGCPLLDRTDGRDDVTELGSLLTIDTIGFWNWRGDVVVLNHRIQVWWNWYSCQQG